MKIWLDDERPAPAGWMWVKTVEDAIQALRSNRVEEISLDHDLGIEATGYDVMLYLERCAFEGKPIPTQIRIHTANSVGREKMKQCLESIERLRKRTNVMH